MYDPAVARAIFLRSQPPRVVLETSPSIDGNLKYYTPPTNGQAPWSRRFHSDSLPETNIIHVEHEEKIYDLRALVDSDRSGETNVNVTGFQVLPKEIAKTEMREIDFHDDTKVKNQYYQETISLLKKITGASRVDIFDSTLRRSDAQGDDTPSNRFPVQFVHLDQTPASGERRVRRHCGADADRLLKSRAALINVWRSIRDEPVKDFPLAVMDSRSIPDTDLIPTRLLFAPPTPEGETFQIQYNVNHRWYYLSEMIRDEVLLLQCWSNVVGAARTPHSGITDTRFVGKEGVTPRHSIEVRALLFWEDEPI